MNNADAKLAAYYLDLVSADSSTAVRLASAASFLRSTDFDGCREIVFRWEWSGFEVDGMPVAGRTKRGLLLAWLIIASHRHHLGEIRCDWISPGNDAHRRCKQMLDRAANAVRPISPTLAKTIDGIGTRRGAFVFVRKPRAVACVSDSLVLAVA